MSKLVDHYPETLRDIYDKMDEAISAHGHRPQGVDVALLVTEWLRKNWSGRTLIPAWWQRDRSEERGSNDKETLELDLEPRAPSPEPAFVDPIATERGRELRSAVMQILLSLQPSALSPQPCFLATAIAAVVELEWSRSQVYVPKAEAFDRAIRDAQIWRQFGGFSTIGSIVDKFKVSQSVIYDISRRLQKDKDAREQPALPGLQ